MCWVSLSHIITVVVRVFNHVTLYPDILKVRIDAFCMNPSPTLLKTQTNGNTIQ
mgnify:CR=1 FL=1